MKEFMARAVWNMGTEVGPFKDTDAILVHIEKLCEYSFATRWAFFDDGVEVLDAFDEETGITKFYPTIHMFYPSGNVQVLTFREVER